MIAARADGTLFVCSHNIGRIVINAKKIANRNGTRRALAACMPKIMIITAAMVTTALVLLMTELFTV
jgi:hypothetical protein